MPKEIKIETKKNNSYVSIRLSTLPTEVPLSFSLYIALKDRHLLYVRKGDDLEDNRLQSLKKKKVRKLFIEESSESDYQDFLGQRITDAIHSDAVSAEERADVIGEVSEQAVEEVYKNPESKESFDGAKKAAGQLAELLGKNDDVLSNLFDRPPDDERSLLVRHAINISSLAINFARHLKVEEKQIEVLGLAGLLCDTGRCKMAPSDEKLFSKPVSEMSSEEKKRYFEHPHLGALLLQDKSYASKELIELIHNHEEKRSGEGFPSGKKQLTLPEEILSFCSNYDRKVTCLGRNRTDVIKNLTLDEVGHYDLKLLKSFQDFAKAEGLI